jgi:hypothetical protein
VRPPFRGARLRVHAVRRRSGRTRRPSPAAEGRRTVKADVHASQRPSRPTNNYSQRAPASAIHNRAFGLQKDCRRRVWRSGEREKSLQIAGGRTWIRTRDLFLIRQAESPAHLGPKSNGPSQGATRTVAISREDQSPTSQRFTTKPIADRTFGLQNDCSGGVSRLMPSTQLGPQRRSTPDSGQRRRSRDETRSRRPSQRPPRSPPGLFPGRDAEIDVLNERGLIGPVRRRQHQRASAVGNGTEKRVLMPVR